MDLEALRDQIDSIDDAIIQLIIQRMNVSAQIAEYKHVHGLPIYVPQREAEILADISRKCPEDVCEHLQKLFKTIFEISKAHQKAYLTDRKTQ